MKGFFHFFSILYLFTASDFKTIVIPTSLFGVLESYCEVLFLGIDSKSAFELCVRWPLTVVWVWLNLLPFNINNQSQPEAISEDSINKGWRPLPSGLIAPVKARILMFFFYMTAILVSWHIGAFAQCLSLIFLGTWYNTWGGADADWMLRNFINVAGYMSFMTGSTCVALDSRQPQRSPTGFIWLITLGAIIFSTVQMQDLQDQDGDRVRGRKTMPLQLGDL
ncbi:hypothetical protein MMC10_011192, partial [Thelotrema lepadinum]|nr:hypothetical protein [Thelotrema lepadinum]